MQRIAAPLASALALPVQRDPVTAPVAPPAQSFAAAAPATPPATRPPLRRSATAPAGSAAGTERRTEGRTDSDAADEESAKDQRTEFDARKLSDGQLDELTHRLISPLTRLLRAELRLDRERIGRLRDPRR